MRHDLVAEQRAHLFQRKAFGLGQVDVEQREGDEVQPEKDEVESPLDVGKRRRRRRCVENGGDEIGEERYGKSLGPDRGGKYFRTQLGEAWSKCLLLIVGSGRGHLRRTLLGRGTTPRQSRRA